MNNEENLVESSNQKFARSFHVTKTEVRMKKRKRRDAFIYEIGDEWLSFSSNDEDSRCNSIGPEERGNSKFNFPNTEYKKQCKFMNRSSMF